MAKAGKPSRHPKARAKRSPKSRIPKAKVARVRDKVGKPRGQQSPEGKGKAQSKEPQSGQPQREGQTQRDTQPKQPKQTQDQKGPAQKGAEGKGGGAGVGGSGSVQLTTEQRTKIRTTVLQGGNAPRVTNVNFNVNVGTVVPRISAGGGGSALAGGDPSGVARLQILHRRRAYHHHRRQLRHRCCAGGLTTRYSRCDRAAGTAALCFARQVVATSNRWSDRSCGRVRAAIPAPGWCRRRSSAAARPAHDRSPYGPASHRPGTPGP